ncbi:MAG: NUDIX hydrolase [Chthoniobacterales bacterium]
MKDGAGWNILREETLLETPYLSVVREEMATPFQPEGTQWLNVRRKQAVVIAPRTSEGNFVLIHQQRIPARRVFWEFPAGQIDGEVMKGSIHETALRELAEETGYIPREGRLDKLGGYFASPGFTNEFMHLFIAHDVELHAAGRKPEESECILEVKEFSAIALKTMIRKGEIQDANTLVLVAKMLVLDLFNT